MKFRKEIKGKGQGSRKGRRLAANFPDFGLHGKPTDDLAFEGIELAAPRHLAPWRIGAIAPVADCLDIERQKLRQMSGAQVFGDAVTNGAPGGLIDQDRPAGRACKRCRRTATGTGSGKLRT